MILNHMKYDDTLYLETKHTAIQVTKSRTQPRRYMMNNLIKVILIMFILMLLKSDSDMSQDHDDRENPPNKSS